MPCIRSARDWIWRNALAKRLWPLAAVGTISNLTILSHPLLRYRNFVHSAAHFLFAARAEGWVRLSRRARGFESRLFEHRTLQRRMAAAFQSAGGRQEGVRLFRSLSPRKNSAFWEVTGIPNSQYGAFLLKSTAPHKLKDAPGGAGLPDRKSAATLKQGKMVFAERCARCHSSKLPTPAQGMDPGGCSGSGYLDCWNKYWAWTKTDDFKTKMRAIASAADFTDNNYMSAEFRVPVTLLETNACSPLATNAIRDNIWDNFSSDTYKDLPSVGEITYYDPYTGAPKQYKMPGGGRGYTRPPSLLSLGPLRRFCSTMRSASSIRVRRLRLAWTLSRFHRENVVA